ncbi:MAG: (E)-4-hydroxy-3-methylbut-2-enyl-diphosphate synthase [Bacteroidales bacterium]|nr:(E)-4-hydroxy-3-methylbut-2-enyl-diphosphate synthase [Bacteroidales bacterium]
MNRRIEIGGLQLGDCPLVVQTMCDTPTRDVEASVAQCIRLYEGGAQMVRLTVPTLEDVAALAEIRARLRASGISVPLVADVHFSSEIALAAASVCEKVRINPGNFHKDFSVACSQFARLLEVCKEHGTALRIGINHGSLGERITSLYGDTPLAMVSAAMEWLRMCEERDFGNVCLSLKSSNTLVMTEAYRLAARKLEEEGLLCPLHLGVTEAGNGDSGRMKSIAAISTLLSEGIGDTIRVSLTEPPENELPVAQYLADRYERRLYSSLIGLQLEGRRAVAAYHAPSYGRLMFDFAADFGKRLLDRDFDEVVLRGSFVAGGSYVPKNGTMLEACNEDSGRMVDLESPEGQPVAKHLTDELMQACRRRFTHPEYIACPGCGRTMFNLQATLEEVKRRTAHLQGMVIAVMGCVVNGPGEMADADWGYVGEGSGKVSIYHGRTPLARHVPEGEAVDKLLELIEAQK